MTMKLFRSFRIEPTVGPDIQKARFWRESIDLTPKSRAHIVKVLSIYMNRSKTDNE